MKRRTFVTGMAAVIAAPTTIQAQQTEKVARIGVLGGAPTIPYWIAFRERLHDLGYVEGQNIIIEWRSWRGSPETLPELAAELVRLNVTVIVAGASVAALAAQRATDTIPIITISGDPVESGLVASLARPGGNVTGVSVLTSDLIGKQLDLLVRHLVSGASRIAILRNPTNPSLPALLRAMSSTAAVLKVKLHIEDAGHPTQFDRAISRIAEKKTEALVVPADPMFFEHRTSIVEMVAKRRLPAMYARSEYVESGGLVSYGPDRNELFRLLAIYADKILKGTKPSDLPIEQPRKLELVLNLKTAKTLGLTIPPSLLLRADQVIE
jgi:putative ABC transport system substrate-binding protein